MANIDVGFMIDTQIDVDGKFDRQLPLLTKTDYDLLRPVWGDHEWQQVFVVVMGGGGLAVGLGRDAWSSLSGVCLAKMMIDCVAMFEASLKLLQRSCPWLAGGV